MNQEFNSSEENITNSIMEGLLCEDSFSVGSDTPEIETSKYTGTKFTRYEYAQSLGYISPTESYQDVQSRVFGLLESYKQFCENGMFCNNIHGDTSEAQKVYRELVQMLMCSGGMTIAPVIDWRVDRSCEEGEEYLSMKKGSLSLLSQRMIQSYLPPAEKGWILNKGSGSGHASHELFTDLRKEGMKNAQVVSIGRELFGSVENILRKINVIDDNSTPLDVFALASICKKMGRFYMYDRKTTQNQPDISQWKMKYPFFDINILYDVLEMVKRNPRESIRHILDGDENLKISYMNEDDEVQELKCNQKKRLIHFFRSLTIPDKEKGLDLNTLVETYFHNFYFSNFLEIPQTIQCNPIFTFSIRSDSHESADDFNKDIIQNIQHSASGGLVVTDGIRGSYKDKDTSMERITSIKNLLTAEEPQFRMGVLQGSTGYQSLILQKHPGDTESTPYIDLFTEGGVSTESIFDRKNHNFEKIIG